MTALRGDGRGLPRRIRLILFAAAAALLLILFRQALGQLLWQIALAVLLAYAARPICARFERRHCARCCCFWRYWAAFYGCWCHR